MRAFNWDKPILGKLTATDFAEAIVGVMASAAMVSILLLLFGGD